MRLPALVILIVLGWSGAVPAAPSCTHADNLDRPRIGLVLGGGGARGISHIGVIRVLEELNVPVDYVAGTSMGSIVGGLYATGMTSDELEATVQSVDWKEIFVDKTQRPDRTFRRKRDDDLSLYGPKLGVGKHSELLPRGAVAGQKIVGFFQDVASQRVQTKDFDDLPIPFRAVATDIIDGTPVIIDDGDLAFAMRSSMSIPGIFAPIEYRDHLLGDGGIAKNLPVDVVRGMGADIVIAVDVGSPLHPHDELDNLLKVTGQLSNILVQRNTMAQRALLVEDDVLIVPELGDKISSADFVKGEQAIGIGLAAGRGARSELAALGIPACRLRGAPGRHQRVCGRSARHRVRRAREPLEVRGRGHYAAAERRGWPAARSSADWTQILPTSSRWGFWNALPMRWLRKTVSRVSRYRWIRIIGVPRFSRRAVISSAPVARQRWMCAWHS